MAGAYTYVSQPTLMPVQQSQYMTNQDELRPSGASIVAQCQHQLPLPYVLHWMPSDPTHRNVKLTKSVALGSGTENK